MGRGVAFRQKYFSPGPFPPLVHDLDHVCCALLQVTLWYQLRGLPIPPHGLPSLRFDIKVLGLVPPFFPPPSPVDFSPWSSYLQRPRRGVPQR